MIRALIRTMRPHQWVKNVFVFAGLVFDEKLKLFDLTYFTKTLFGFVLLCLISGAVYLLNDLVDIDKDRQHPKKKNRPLPSGELPVGVARGALVLIPLVCLPLSFWLDPLYAVIVTGYLVLQIGYSFVLKHVVLLDVFAIAAGFVLRVAAGVVLVDATRFSPWLYLCITLLALFMGFGKRRHEIVLLQGQANNHRSVLAHYNLAFLDQMISMILASIVVAYALYTFSAPNLPANHLMMLTVPFVMYALFRYLYLIHLKNEGGAPENILLRDRPFQFTLILWGMTSVSILYL